MLANRPTRRSKAVRWATVLLCGLTGCAGTLKKKNDGPDMPPPASTGGQPFWADPGAPAPKNNGTLPANVPATGPSMVQVSASDPEISGILAGRLVDSYNRPVAAASIQVDPVGERSGAPQEVEVDPVNSGRFYIKGLSPGKSYRLTARARSDSALLVGEVIARPPDARLLIPMSEDLAGPGAVAPPGPPQSPILKPREPVTAPTPAPWNPPSAELGSPRTFAPAVSLDAERIANDSTNEGAPRANIPGLPVPISQPTPVNSPSASFGPAPACLVANGRVQTLTLKDPDGQVWDFSQRFGRLTLIDFWGTWCGPCVKAIPEVARLQSNYRSKGLEVIGIACENGSAADNAQRVNYLRRKLPSINYRLLMAGEPERDPVRAQFQLSRFPTLVLVDEDGTILWRGGANDIPTLEKVIQQRLGS